MKLLEISSKRLQLRSLSYRDTEVIFEIFSNPDVTRYWVHDTLRNKTETEAFIKKTIDGASDGSLLEWGITEKENKTLIGVSAYAGWNKEHHRAEISFALNKDQWAKKYMSELLPVFINFGFKDLGLHRIEADVNPRNIASIRLLGKNWV